MVYTGKKKLKPLIKFVEKEMEKAKKYRAKVNDHPYTCAFVCFYSCLCLRAAFFFQLKIYFSPLCIQEDEDRRKYTEAMKAEEAKKANNTKDEL